jgi:2-methylisocitrate lyase-like PEP mutase family enzyme
MPGPHPATLTPPVEDDLAARFRALHESFFVMPNPWDAGSARLLAALGFPAIASSSAALAWTLGRPDGGVDRRTAITHAAMLAEASGLPVNGDFEQGYGEMPADVADTVTASIEAGVSGCSIEDLWPGGDAPLYDLPMACRRVEAAREAAERSGSAFVLTARCEVFLTAVPDKLNVAIERLRAYEAAGAHAVYAPGITTGDEVKAIVEAVSVPVNVLAGLGGISDELTALRALGVRRISLGSNLFKVAMGSFLRAAEALAGGRVELPGSIASVRMNAAFGG